LTRRQVKAEGFFLFVQPPMPGEGEGKEGSGCRGGIPHDEFGEEVRAVVQPSNMTEAGP